MKERKIALMVTCLADLFRPSVAKSCMQLLNEYAAHEPSTSIVLAKQQVCCGQPGYTNGYIDEARKMAIQNIESLKEYDKVIVPSASCAGMIKHHYVSLCQSSSNSSSPNSSTSSSPSSSPDEQQNAARKLAAKTYELTEFLLQEGMSSQKSSASQPRSYSPNPADGLPSPQVVYHDNCAALREMKISESPRAVLKKYCNITVNDLTNKEVCCGFGGTFCMKYPHLAKRMADDKINDAVAVQSPKLTEETSPNNSSKNDLLDNAKSASPFIVTSTDLGCLLHLARHSRKRQQQIYFYHISELLTGAWRTLAPLGRVLKPRWSYANK